MSEDDQGDHAITVVIVEDHAVLADSLSRALAAGDGIEILDTAGDLATGLSVIAARRPRVVLMDANLPDGDGASAAAAARECSPDTAVVVISGSEYPSVVTRAVRSGASGFLSKAEPLSRVVDAIRTAAAGGVSFTPEQLQRATAATPEGESELTDRELEVLQLLADGASTQDIAERLTLSIHTVRNHVRNLTDKLGATARVEAVAIAHRRGLVTPPRA